MITEGEWQWIVCFVSRLAPTEPEKMRRAIRLARSLYPIFAEEGVEPPSAFPSAPDLDFEPEPGPMEKEKRVAPGSGTVLYGGSADGAYPRGPDPLFVPEPPLPVRIANLHGDIRAIRRMLAHDDSVDLRRQLLKSMRKLQALAPSELLAREIAREESRP